MASKSSFDVEEGMTRRRDARALAVALEDEDRVESSRLRTEPPHPHELEPNERECLVSINIIHASGYE